MVSPVTQTPQTTRTSIFYINDVHSNLTNIEKLKNASDQFDSFTPSQPTDKLKFSSGDIGVGRDKAFSKVAVAFQNETGIMASATGNHEFDLKKQDLVDILKEANYKFLAVNVEIPQDTSENKELRKDIIKSYVQEQNGDKYGVIGLMPYDFEYHLSDPQEYKDFGILSAQRSAPLVQKEIDDLKKQGINKIIVLSHIGYAGDVELAKSVEGIDVILGGHTHDLIEGIEEGKNLFYSQKTGEPTIITQAGKNGDDFGVLNLEFDQNGVIKKAQNNVQPSANYPRSLIMRFFTDKILGRPQVVGTIKSAPKHVHSLIKENPGANFLVDVERAELGVDLAFVNAGNIRGVFEAGRLTNRDLQIITPFDNKLWILRLNQQEIVDALKVSAKSLANDEGTPGIIQFSGLKYTVTKSGDLKSATIIDKNGKETQIDINNPDPNKIYSVAVDDFIAKGGNGYLSGKTDNVETKFDFDKNKLVENYLKKLNAPVEIKDEKRITIVE